MSVDRLNEAGVTLTETWMAPMAVDPQEELELAAIYNKVFDEQEMMEGIEISFADLPFECCPEDRQLTIEQNTEYAGTHEQFN